MYPLRIRIRNGSIRMFSITLKIAVDRPNPSASVKTATTANPGVPQFLSAYRTIPAQLFHGLPQPSPLPTSLLLLEATYVAILL